MECIDGFYKLYKVCFYPTHLQPPNSKVLIGADVVKSLSIYIIVYGNKMTYASSQNK